jgi:hypothetical protein
MSESAAMQDVGRAYGGNKNEDTEEGVQGAERHRGTEPESTVNEMRRE